MTMSIVKSIVDDVFNAIDSREDTSHTVITEVEALSSYDVCAAGTDGHEECEPDDPCCGMDDWPSVRDVGDVVATWLRDRIDAHVTCDVMKILFLDLLDLGNSSVLDELGRVWYPGDAYRALMLAGRISE